MIATPVSADKSDSQVVPGRCHITVQMGNDQVCVFNVLFQVS